MASSVSSARPRLFMRSVTTSRGTSRLMATSMPLAPVMPRSSSAWASVRGKPSSRKPCPTASGFASRSRTTPIITSSGTRSPADMYPSALRPNSVPSSTAARSMSPVEMCGTPYCSAKRTLCVPLPAP